MIRASGLLLKYVVVLVALVAGALLASGGIELWFSYQENKDSLLAIQNEKALGAAARIEAFVKEIERQMGWTTQPQLVAPSAALEQRRMDFIRLQKQVHAITEMSFIDATGKEQVSVSRVALEVIGSQIDFSNQPRFRDARRGTWFGPVYFRKESEPYMTIAMPVASGGGVVAAEVNLKFIWDVVSQIKVGKSGRAFVIDGQGNLIAHPDISLVLQKTSLAGLPQVRAALAGQPTARTTVVDLQGREVLAAYSTIAPLRWTVFVEQPVEEAFVPVRASITRTVVLIVFGIAASIVASLFLARRMVRPIRALQAGAARIGAGELGLRLDVRSGDEIGALARQFNEMTARLHESYATLERRVEERTRELSQALEQQTATSEILRVISSSPTDVSPVFRTIVESAARLCDASFGGVFQFDGEHLTVGAAHNIAPEHAAGLQQAFPLAVDDAGAIGESVRTRRVVHIPDFLEVHDPEREPDYLWARIQPLLGFRTVLVVPMLREGAAIGAIVIWRTEPRPFADSQIGLLKTFADQAVIAIENVRLFTELQEKNRAVSEALEQQTATSEILRVISSSPTDVQPVFDTITRSAVKLCNATSSIVTTFDGELIHLSALSNLNPEGADALRRRFPMRPGRESGASRAILSRAIVQIPDTREDPELVLRDAADAAQYRSVLVVPMLRDGNPIGTVNVHKGESGPFSDDQVQLLKTFADQAVIAIENVRLFTELQEKNRAVTEALEQQTATAEILSVISSSPTDVQPVLDAIVRSAATLCDARHSAAFLVNGDNIEWAAQHNYTPEAEAAMRAVFPRSLSRDTATGQALIDRRVRHIRDVEGDPQTSSASREIARAFGYRSLVVVPMIREGQAIGTINVSRVESPFTDKQIELLKTFADQAVIAIENVRLFTELQEKNRAVTEALEQQTATAQILGVISSSPTDVQPVFTAILASAVRLCGARFGGVFRFDGELVHFVTAHEWPAEHLEVVRRHFPMPPGDESLVARSIRDRRIVQVRDYATEPTLPPWAVENERQLGARSTIALPMLREGNPVGGIVLARAEAGLFSENQVALLQTFADQAVIAIENVRLFTELQRRNRDVTEALEQQTATSEILRVISGSPTNTEPVFRTILDSATRLCEANVAALFLYDGEYLHAAAHHNVTAEFADYLARTRMRPSHETTTRLAALERRTVHVADLMSDQMFAPTVAHGLENPRTVLSVPMLREGSLVGVITSWRREVRPFTDKQIALVQTFADQAVIAIENVRLFTELQERTRDLARSVDQLTALGEVSRAVSSTLDLDRVLNTVVSRASQLAGADGCSIYEYDEQVEGFRVRATSQISAELIDTQRATILRLGEGAVGRLMETRAPVQIPDIAEERAYGGPLKDALLAGGFRALLAVPMIRENRVVGGLVVSRKAPGEFPQETVELLLTFANQSALAIENARLFREIEDKGRQLEVANRHKSEFLANMSHELRTPLNAIIGFSEVLVEKMFGDVNEKQEEYLRDIYSSGRHLLSLINDILDLAKIEAGRMELELTKFDLPQAIQNAIMLVRGRADAHAIRLDVDVDRRLGDFAGDERKIKQIMANLLSNAVKFTPEAGRVSVRAELVNGSVEIAVRDTGIGIAPEDQQAVFEEFRQVGTDYARKREGTGLGLALTKRFVELHGGSITLKSAVGEGSTFTFTLPVRPWPTSSS